MKFDENATVPKMIKKIVDTYPNIIAQQKKNKEGKIESLSYFDMYQLGLDFGAALINLGLKRGDPIGLISDNRPEWLQADIGIMGIGAVDVPRGCDATLIDLEKILSITEAKYVIAENASQIKKILSLKEKLPCITTIITFDTEVTEETNNLCKENKIAVHTYEQLINSGKKWRIDNPGKVEAEFEKGKGDDLATIIFTSGTTGTPKGVMLTHTNFLAQLDEIPERIFLSPGEKAISVLPVWHVFEREVEYVMLIQAVTICYSKPVGSILLQDFKDFNPQIIPAVPRIFEAIYDGIYKKMRKTGGVVYAMFKFFVGYAKLHKKISRRLFAKYGCYTSYKLPLWWLLLFIPWVIMWPLYWLGDVLVFSKIKSMLGTDFHAGVAGGGAFPKKIDEFFWAIGVEVVEGYGLTETAPIIAVRPLADPIYRTIGSPIRGVEARIVDRDGYILGRCKEGVLQVRGPTVMKGYYKNPEKTAEVMTVDGWLDTGDLAILTIHNELQIKGRIKDTIVLRGGENLEPVPIEIKLTDSRFIQQAIVLGQDQRYLGALILVDKEEMLSYAQENGIQYDTYEKLLKTEEILRLFEGEIADLISSKNGFKMFERISKFALITKPFEVGVELSAKQEIMRFRINELYKNEINEMFKE